MARILLALVVLGSLLARTGQAATSASITLWAMVQTKQGLMVTPLPGYNSLDILHGANNQTVALVNENSNGNNGYRVTLRSANANAVPSSQPTLHGTGANTDQVPYSITYNDQPVVLDGTGTATVTSFAGRSPPGGITKPLKVTFSPTWVNPDTYSDTLILTIYNKD